MDFVTINDLPSEIIFEIFSYLTLSDLLEASLVCKNWYDEHLQSKTLERMILTLNDTNFEKYKPILAKRRFYNIMFHYVNFNEHQDDLKLWQEIGENIQYLMFTGCVFTPSQLFSILQTTKNLLTLKIEIWNFIEPIETTAEFNLAKDMLKSVTTFKFVTLNGNNIKLFDILIDMMPNLKNFETDNSRSNCAPIFKTVLKRAKTLQSLIIFGSSPPRFIAELTKVKNLQLKTLNVRTLLTPFFLKALITKQKSITDYYVINPSEDDEFQVICNKLVNIEHLYIKLGFVFTDDGIKNLCKLKNLRFFQINNICDSITTNGLIEALKGVNVNLRFLTLRLNISGEHLLKNIANRFHELRELAIVCESDITDADIQIVWKNLHWLRSVYFACDGATLTDVAFTGISTENDDLGSSIGCVKGLKHFNCLIKCDITVKALTEIAKLNEITSLNINIISKVDIEDLKILSNCKSMEKLSVGVLHEKLIKNPEELRKLFPRIKSFKIKTSETGKYLEPYDDDLAAEYNEEDFDMYFNSENSEEDDG